MVVEFTTEPPTNYYQYANETPPAGSLLVAIDEFVDKYQIGQTGDDMLRCSIPAHSCWELVLSDHSPLTDLDAAHNATGRLVSELSASKVLMHGTGGNKSPKQGFVAWLKEISDRDRGRAMADMSVVMIMVMIDEFCQEYGLDEACEKFLKFEVPIALSVPFIFHHTAVDRSRIESARNASSVVTAAVKELLIPHRGPLGKGGKGSGKGKGKGKGKGFHESPRPGRFRSVNKGPGCDSSLERASSRIWSFLEEQGAPDKARGILLSGCSAASAIEAVRNASNWEEARNIALGKDQEFTSLPSITVLENGVTSWVQRATVDERVGDLLRRLLSIADLDDVLAGRVPSLEADSLAAGAREGTYRNVSAFANAQIRRIVESATDAYGVPAPRRRSRSRSPRRNEWGGDQSWGSSPEQYNNWQNGWQQQQQQQPQQAFQGGWSQAGPQGYQQNQGYGGGWGGDRERIRDSTKAFVKYHYGHLRYKLNQLTRTLEELREDSPWMLAVILAVLAVVSINFIFVTWITCKFIPLWLTFLLQLIVFWIIVKFVALTAVFPGGNMLWRRRIEGLYCDKCVAPPPAQEPQAAVFMVEGLLRNYDDQTKNLGVSLTEDQQQLRDCLEELHHWMKSTKLDLGGAKKMSFRDYMCRGEFSNHWVRFEKTKHNLDVPMKALLKCDRLLGEDESGGLVQNLRAFFRPQILGSLHHLKSELINRYSARAFTVGHLDGVYVPSYRQQSLPADSPESGTSLLETKVIVWCNPNAAYYECAVYQPEWLDFYLGLGYGIVLWNYRGFGDSEGLCTPGSLYTDSEAIMQWVAAQGAKRGHGFVQRVGVHGRSVGGVTACHLGKVYDRPRPGLKLDFVVADRTFRTLEATARSTVGHWAALALRLTGIAASNVEEFLSIHDTPKILTCDPRDTIIPEDANLRTGVAARLVADLPPELRLSSISRYTLYEASLALAYLPRFMALIGVNEDSENTSSIEELLFILGLSRDSRISSLAGFGGPHQRSDSASSTATSDVPSSRPRISSNARTNGRYIELQELGASATNSDESPASVSSDGGRDGCSSPAESGRLPQLVEHGRSIEMPTVDANAPTLDTYSIEDITSTIAPYLEDLKRLLDVIQVRVEAGGQPLADVGTEDLPDYRGASVEHWPLTEWIDKMQVWGSVTPIPEDSFTARFRACPHFPRVAEEYAKETSRISQCLYGDTGVDAMSIDPFALLRWHRQQSALSVSIYCDDWSQTVAKMRAAVTAQYSSRACVPVPVAAALWAVVSIDNFLCDLRRGFARQECSNAAAAMASPSTTAYTLCTCICSDPEAVSAASDHRLAVYDCPVRTGNCWCVHIHCGHNEALSKVEERELRMHIRYALSITAAEDDQQQQPGSPVLAE
ncbi:hypothetical protein FOL46_000468 [Perkinsus olseni]|uniref:Xaa-Pro dipeptidyl-peptidase-like domain-containing protein n=1 Tax=Perkinsus olseni TaxID=32597 RepID=A0A7J6MWV4_PEROL|nr:hypothetical protein FOL46_000468 [Perkinsus olseni]